MGFDQSCFANLLLLWITKKTDFQNKYTRQNKLFFSPWRISLCKVNPRKHSPRDFPKAVIFGHADFPAKTKKTNLLTESIQMWRYLPPFLLIRDFGKQNTRRIVSKISISLACYRQIGGNKYYTIKLRFYLISG